MGKKRQKLPLSAEESVAPFNAAFAGLGSLRASLPEGDPLPVEPPPQTSASDDAPLPCRVVLQRERKGRGGKTITRVHGLALGDADALHSWCKRLKRDLGCGGLVEGDDLILHGDIVDRVIPVLRAAGVASIIRGN